MYILYYNIVYVLIIYPSAPAADRKALHTMGSLCAEVAQLKDVAATAATSIATERLAGGEKLNALQIIIFYTLTKT